MILVSVLLLTPEKRLWIATSCVLLLRRSRGYLLRDALRVRLPIGLLRHRMRLVVLLYKAQNINQQLRARIPTICRGWIPAPPDEVTRPTSFLIAVVQQALHEEALATARIIQWMRRRRKHVLRQVCRLNLLRARAGSARARNISELQTRADSQHREHKYLLEMLERKGFLYRKKSRTGDKV
uniref:Uncharacterized protein n=1 Tax=Hyaloperonospora arabidopsidis (strain Emoy2) TaxID=559515 RepID=M4BHI7_HYAAE